MNWRWISLAALLAALVAGYGALTGRDASHVTVSESDRLPSYFLRDALIVQTEKDGAPGLRLAASRIDQDRTGGDIHLTSVRVEFLRTQQREWVLTAREGHIPAESRVIEFRGDVHLRPIDNKTTTFLRTDALSIDTERQVAYSTSTPVNIRFGTYAMTVGRFEADLNTEKVKLESVRGRSERG
jgi:LPS export ABC transporter protein LptC